VTLSDEIFNKGFLYGLNPGEKCGATVEATITYDAAPTPEPASVLLVGAGLLGGLGLLRRKLNY
jgi:hypothetical protein